MTALIENIRKVMGWCPNATAIVTKRSLQFDDLTLNAPDREGKTTHVGAGWWNKHRNRILLQSLIFTLMAVLFFVEHESVNMGMFLTGAIVGLFFRLLTGLSDWRLFNGAAIRKYKQSRSIKKRYYVMSFVMICLIVAVIIFFITSLMRIASMTGMQELLIGFLLFEWINYLKVLYWEQKNGKTLIMKKGILFCGEYQDQGD
jgi:Ca2+/Na+ antiporter